MYPRKVKMMLIYQQYQVHNPNSDNSNPDSTPVTNGGWIESDVEILSDNEESGNRENFEILTNNEYVVDDNPNVVARCFNGSLYKKRINPKVIRYRKYDKTDDIQLEDYYREQLMLSYHGMMKKKTCFQHSMLLTVIISLQWLMI